MFSTKRPGMNVNFQAMRMDFFLRPKFQQNAAGSLRRLLLDALAATTRSS